MIRIHEPVGAMPCVAQPLELLHKSLYVKKTELFRPRGAMSNALATRPKSLRIPGYVYTTPGFYFITICSYQRRCIFATVEDVFCHPSDLGLLIQECWQALPQWFPTVCLDYFVIMPNHIHGIVQLTSPDEHSLATVVSSFKSAVTRRARESKLIHQREFVWQRGYFDHIVRSEVSLMALRQYIVDNPVKWNLDELNPFA
jgi:REP element-mobilizing transposase RayT